MKKNPSNTQNIGPVEGLLKKSWKSSRYSLFPHLRGCTFGNIFSQGIGYFEDAEIHDPDERTDFASGRRLLFSHCDTIFVLCE